MYKVTVLTKMTSSSNIPETSTTAAQHVSENPLDFLSMIIYVRRGIKSCEELTLRTSQRMDVLVQDVDSIQGTKPAWLKGVPTVILLPNRDVLTGSRAIDYVCKMCDNELQGVGGTKEAGVPLQDQEKLNAGFSSLFVCEDEKSLPVNDERYRDQPREKKNDVSLEEVMRIRGH